MSGRDFTSRIIIFVSMVIGLCSIASSAEASGEVNWQTEAELLGYKPGELIVRFAPKPGGKDRTKSERNQLLAKINGGIVKDTARLVPGLTLVKLPTGSSVANSLAGFRNRKEVLYAQPNRYLKGALSVPDDTRFDKQWALNNTGQTGGTEDCDIDAPEAWEFATGGSSIIVAVIDSGVDYDHEDLSVNMWVNPAEKTGDGNGDGKPGVAGVDDDGDGLIDEDSEERQPGDPGYTNDLVNDDDENGYVDDIYGYDFVNNDGDPNDGYGHGTHCAGIIGAVGNNDTGITGVCWNVSIMALKCMSDDGGMTDYTIYKSIEYAVQMGAGVLSISWGHSDSKAIKDTIYAARDAGVLFVASAGNNGTDNDKYPKYPASYDLDNIISVMATDEDDQRSIWDILKSSNWGADSVDLAAPGTGILSCIPGNRYKFKSGTTPACPFVAGACALVWSRNPGLSHTEVKDIILDTADKLESLNGLCVTGGRLNLYNAIVAAGNVGLTIDDGLGDDAFVPPEDFIEYRIWYANHITDANEPDYVGDANDVVIIDYLPDEGAEFILAEPDTGQYDPNARTYTWPIGKLSPGQEGSLTIMLQVEKEAEPLSEIVNTVEFESNVACTWAAEETAVCCYDGDVIYVDSGVVDPNDGSSWNEAFDRLDDALEAANICDEIWVAQGNYMPTTNPNNHKAKFSIPRGIWMYGGFSGDEQERWQRNWFVNETTLSGVIDSAENEPNRVECVVVSDANNILGLVDGFTITGGAVAGVYCEKSSLLISHNKLTSNQTAIHCERSKEPVIVNNWLYRNSCGLYFDDPIGVATVRNNTVANNDDIGIYLEYGIEPQISNCIFWGNDANDLLGCSARYSCIEEGLSGLENISSDPCFADASADNYLLEGVSLCIDAGDPEGDYGAERDIDKHFRILDGDGDGVERVDMGADEYCNEGYDNVADFNLDDIVDELDLIEFAEVWLTDSDDPGWDDTYDLYDDNIIDYIDFAYFAVQWLWMTCEMMQGYEMMEMMMGAGGGESMFISEPADEQIKTTAEPSIEEQIEQIKYILDWLYEIKDQIDEDIWLNLTTSLEEMLKALQDD